MAHPTALWRVLWRFFVFCLLVGRILADARETFAAARCSQDELMQPCVDAALGEATGATTVIVTRGENGAVVSSGSRARRAIGTPASW